MNNEKLSQSLRTLADVTAPSTLAPAVLVSVGLIDQYASIETPLGTGYLAWNGKGISALMVMPQAADFEQYFAERFQRRLVLAAKPDERLLDRVRTVLAGDKAALDFDLRGMTDFERAVLIKALDIPRGEIRPYSWIAREIDNPKAVRAVGSALGHNPIPLLIPCHRVVRSDGKIGNYLFGSDNKRHILEMEGINTREVENTASRGVKFYGSDTTGIYCYPSCRNARRITDVHRVQFHSESEAQSAGYRACKVCRPA